MKYILVLMLAVLTGCSTTVPVAAKFPEAPETLLKTCPPLASVKDDVKLSELTSTVAGNYQLYHSCSNSVDGWIEWYKKQKSIFDKSSKN